MTSPQRSPQRLVLRFQKENPLETFQRESPNKWPSPSPEQQRAISKALTTILRHQADQLDLPITSNGFVLWETLQRVVKRIPRFSSALNSVDPLLLAAVVRLNDKQRLRLAWDENGGLYVGATQGHSLPEIYPDLQPITDPSAIPMAVHGTNMRAWKEILAFGGLSRMGRTHIHFASGLPGDSGIISGMRTHAEVYLFLDLPKLLSESPILLFRSLNGVILSPGERETGQIPLSYIKRVIHAKTNAQLYPI